jgi:hypothetical protein
MTAQIPVRAGDRDPDGWSYSDTQAIRATLYLVLALSDAGIVAAAFGLSDLLRHGNFTDMATLSYWLIVPIFMAASLYVRAYSYTTLIARHLSIWKAAATMPASDSASTR